MATVIFRMHEPLQQHQEDGLVLKVYPFKDKDLVVSVLLRNGKKRSLFLRGAKNNQKAFRDPIDHAHLFTFCYSPRRSTLANRLISSSEWNCQWAPSSIRHNVDAYYLTCLFIDCIDRAAMEHDDSEEGNSLQSTVGDFFRLLSNALFFLNQAAAQKQVVPQTHFLLFFVKFLQYLGLFPQIQHCLSCQKHLPSHIQSQQTVFFHLEKGGFTCQQCEGKDDYIQDELDLWSLFLLVGQSKYSDYEQIPYFSPSLLALLTRYFFYHSSITLPILEKLPAWSERPEVPLEGPEVIDHKH